MKILDNGLFLTGVGVAVVVGAKALKERVGSRASDYSRNDPRGWGGDPTRGAALGRPTVDADNPNTFTGKLTIKRTKIDSGGYDKNGTYFGIGNPLFWVSDDDGDVDYMIRAYDREEARNKVLGKYPKAKVAR